MAKTYDTILVLAGENKELMPRSKKAVEIYKQGRAGSIFVTGGIWGLAKQPYTPDGERSVEYIRKHLSGENQLNLFLFHDYRSHETAGNYALPLAKPLPRNPDLKDLGSMLVVIEEGHLRDRGKKLAEKVIPKNKLEFEVVKGTYESDLNSKAYSIAMLRALRHIKEAYPQAVHEFLVNKHPFYQKEWFEKPLEKRTGELKKTCLRWLAGFR